MTTIAYTAKALTGGGATALDFIDGTDLADGDLAFVTVSGIVYVYRLDATSGETESSPAIIQPDDNAGDKRWILQEHFGIGPGRNAIINPIGEINQRVTAFTLVSGEYCWDNSDLYGPDRHEGMGTGTAVTAGTFGVTTSASVGVSGKAFKFAGVTLTGTGVLYHRYRMEAADAAKFKNQTCCFTSRVYHDVGSAKNFTVYVNKADAADNFAAVTAIGNSGAQSIESATASDCNYLAIEMGDCSNGIEIEIKMEVGAITTKNVELTEFQFELGSVSTDFEYSGVNDQRAKCIPYCQKSYDDDVAPGTADTDGSIYSMVETADNADYTMDLSHSFHVPMRDTPAMLCFDMAGTSGKCTLENGDGIAATVTRVGTHGFTVESGTNGALDADHSIAYHHLSAAEL